jgi:hypothetical protein
MDITIFTVEEENLICIYDIGGRAELIRNIQIALPYFDDDELRDIADNVIRKLNAMTDDDFSSLTFSPVYMDDESEV